ncbi:hypothetical protein B0H67DRAFT_686655 [Lasiosphaeris hirsuta]|uniref:Uncharacterized protein n=1 Tax=Lasiosphaeris hirsuta TaxID=260670 RepID=A0AA40A3J9_9PEZI|nr:hypothetical protein B0H67DRAFT_686655 [Lasiosphaeris hirsuta]
MTLMATVRGYFKVRHAAITVVRGYLISMPPDRESLALAASAAHQTPQFLIVAIIAVLAYYDNKPLPSWPSSITLNAVIAILATVATASMTVSLSSELGQLKWIRFRERGARRSLAWNTLMMLVVALWGLPPCSSGPMNTRALKYDLQLPDEDDLAAFVPILPIKSAVYNGLFAENNKPSMNLPVKCSTGNCTWGEIETLAICHKCTDMTEYMTRYCADGTLAVAVVLTAVFLGAAVWKTHSSGTRLRSSHE